MSRRPFGLALVCFAAATSLSAQPAAGSRPSVTMVVSVQAKKTVVVKDGEAQLHWVIAELPKPETIDMGGDEAFRRELASVLSGLAARKGAGEGKCLDLVAEIDADNEACSLWDALRKTFALPRRIGLSAADPLRQRPTAETAAAEAREIKFSYLAGVSTPLISRYAVELQTAFASAASAGTGTAVVSRPVTLASDRLPQGISASDVTVTALYTAQDRYPGAGNRGADLFSDGQLTAALAEVAADVLRVVVDKQLTLGAVPDRVQASALADQIEQNWSMNSDATGWPKVSASAKPEDDGSVPIQVTGLRLVRDARVRITTAEKTANPANQAKLDAIAQRGGETVQAAHRDVLAELRGQVPKLDPVLKARDSLGQPKQVDGPFLVKSEDGVLFYDGNFRGVVSLLDAKFDAQLGINPQERFTAGGSISGARLFYLVPTLFGRPAAGDLGESHSLTAKGGPDFQTIDYSLTREFALWSGKLLPIVDLDWKRDTEQRFGPAFQPVPEELARGIRPGVSWTQVVSSDDTSRWSHSLSLDLGLPLRHTRLIPKTAGARDLIDQQVTALAFETKLGAGYDFTPNGGGKDKKRVRLRAGHANLRLHTDSRRGWNILGGDSTFFHHAVDLGAVLPWGLTMPDQFQLRYARGAGTGSRSTPLFELYRLGGADNVRGIEMGEFVGRNLAWEQAEFGYNLFEPIEVLSKLFARRKKAKAGGAPPAASPADAAAAPPAATPSDAASPATPAEGGGGIAGFLRQNGISTLLIKVAHDRGLVTDNGRGFGDLFSLQHASHGWGVGLELGGLRTAAGTVSLTLMRARSPSSYVHPHGVWSTGVRIAF